MGITRANQIGLGRPTQAQTQTRQADPGQVRRASPGPLHTRGRGRGRGQAGNCVKDLTPLPPLPLLPPAQWGEYDSVSRARPPGTQLGVRVTDTRLGIVCGA